MKGNSLESSSVNSAHTWITVVQSVVDIVETRAGILILFVAISKGETFREK